jgi:hypothetical protein
VDSRGRQIASVLALFLFLGWVGLAFGQLGQGGTEPGPEQIPKEPGWRHPSYRGWELLSINGMVGTYYDLDLDGVLDYMVIRKILRQVSAEDVSIEDAVEIAQFENSSVYVSYPVIYFANRNPMFYCRGVDNRKNCEHIWVDVQEDGLNGNEVLYSLSIPNPLVR